MSEVPETLLGLLRHYSPSGKEAAAVGWLIQRMQSLGFDRAYVDETGNAVGEIGGGDKEIILLGHIDTVEGEITVRIEGESLYGRGSVDAKGPLAAFVDAAGKTPLSAGWKLIVIGALDEEGDSKGARAVAERYQPAFAIIGEPSRWERVTLGYKGSASTSLTVKRPVAHNAGKEEGACEAAFNNWGELKDWAASYNDGKERNFDQLQIVLKAFSSGGDGFTDWANLQIGARLPLSMYPEQFYGEISARLPEVEITPQGTAIPAYLAEKNTTLVRAFLASIRKLGGKPGFVLKSGTSDLNIVGPQWNCPTVVYGPGDSALDHTPNEHVSIAEYHRAVGVLVDVLSTLASSEKHN